MNYKAQAIKMLKKCNNQLKSTVQAVPADKLDWQPLEVGRSVLSMLQECALTPFMLAKTLEHQGVEWFTPEVKEQGEEQQQGLTDADACLHLMEENTAVLISALENFPETEMETMVTLPFGAGGDWSMADIMLGHYWNNTYHVGQIAYIQTLWCDEKNHLV